MLKQHLQSMFDQMCKHTLIEPYDECGQMIDNVKQCRGVKLTDKCEEFILDYGGILAVHDGNVQSIWDAELPHTEDNVQLRKTFSSNAKLAKTISAHEFEPFVPTSSILGTEGAAHTYLVVPPSLVFTPTADHSVANEKARIKQRVADLRKLLSPESKVNHNIAVDTINAAFKSTQLCPCPVDIECFAQFLKLGVEFNAQYGAYARACFAWASVNSKGNIAGTRIGDLYVSLYEGDRLMTAVDKYNDLVLDDALKALNACPK